MLKPGYNAGVSNRDYHGDKEYLSSSALKTLLRSAAEFENNYILGNAANVQKNVFDEGSLVHALILEPEVLDEEFAFYPGFTKRGNAFKAFTEENPGKIYISASQNQRCKKYVEAYERSQVAKDLLTGGFPEHTLCEELMGIKIKVRPDYINIDEGYIIDVKTSGSSVDVDIFKDTVDRFGYALSAALYCEVAKKIYGRPFDFYFVAISKPEEVCEVYKLSAASYEQGRDDIAKALGKLKKCRAENNWTEFHKPAKIVEGNYEILEV